MLSVPIMPRKRKSILTSVREIKRLRSFRYGQSQQQSEVRQTANARRTAAARERETPEQSEVRQTANARRTAAARESKTPEQTRIRQTANARLTAAARERETPEQTRVRQTADARLTTAGRERETPEQTRVRLSKIAQRRAAKKIESSHHRRAIGTNYLAELEEHYCGPMNILCRFCGSKNFIGEKKKGGHFTCCKKGKVDPSQFASPDYPDFFKQLLRGEHHHSKNFLENIRSFSSAFSFASMGAQIDRPRGIGPYCFRIHGQIYHHSPKTLHPAPGEPRKYAQLYILDTAEAVRQRLEITSNSLCEQSIMTAISKFMAENNSLAQGYKMMHEIELEGSNEGHPPYQVFTTIKHDRSLDARRYNTPHCNEVAAVFQNTNGVPPFNRDLKVYLRPGTEAAETMQRISVLHPSLEPMTYPLLFPFGETGWHPNMLMLGTAMQLTQMAYYGYRLAVRDPFNQFLNTGKLTQQYVVDAYVKMESNRLKWIREHQKDIQGLMDHLLSEAVQRNLTLESPSFYHRLSLEVLEICIRIIRMQ